MITPSSSLITKTLAGIFILASVGAAAVPDAMAMSPEFRPSASESIKDYCTAPDTKEELQRLAESQSDRNRYAADLAFDRMVCAQLRLAALAEEADVKTAPAVVGALSSITRDETDQAILETAVEELKNLALKYESVSEDAVFGIRHRLSPANPALRNDEFVRQRAVSSMGKIGYQYESLRPKIAQDMLLMAGDESFAVRESVATHLGRFIAQHKVTGELRDKTLGALQSLAQDKNRMVRDTAGLYLTPATLAPQP